jgi:hypothetical protein
MFMHLFGDEVGVDEKVIYTVAFASGIVRECRRQVEAAVKDCWLIS